MIVSFFQQQKNLLMKNCTKLIKLTLIITTSVIMFSCANNDDNLTPHDNNMAGIVSRSSKLSNLVVALDKTYLVETLDQSGT